MQREFEIVMTVPSDEEDMVAEIWFDSLLAIVRLTDGEFNIQMFPSEVGKGWWHLGFDELLAALIHAKKRLAQMSGKLDSFNCVTLSR